MSKKYNVISLCDGISCGRIALEQEGFEIGNFYSSEIEPNAIKVAEDNYPQNIQLGDLTKIDVDVLPKIDIFFAGTPYQGVSLANRGGQDVVGSKSELVFDIHKIFVKLKEKNPQMLFLIENVKMSKENKQIFDELFGVEGFKLDSADVSIQHRERLYWTNIPNIEPLPKLDAKLKDNYCKVYDESLVLKGKGLNKLERGRNRMISVLSDKCPTLMKSQDKLPTDSIVFEQDGIYRYPTRRECELMQNVPENYTKAVNYRVATGLLGNGWNINTIRHILKHIKNEQ